MGIATGLTAARMQEIIDQQIVSGAIDLSGRLIFTREDGSKQDAGVVKGDRGDPANYRMGTFGTNSVVNYIRLGVIDGLNASNGGHFQFILSGLGNIGTARRGTVLVHATQRGINVVNVRAWSWGLDETVSNTLRLFTKQTGDYMFEIWAGVGLYTLAGSLTELSTLRTTITMDSKTTFPADLTEWPIERSDSPAASQTLAGIVELATTAEALAGDATRAVTPSIMRWYTREVTVATGTTAERNAFFGTPTTDAARVALANRKIIWFNTDLGWEEQYYATTGLSGLTARGLIAGFASGWYPTGRGPRVELESAGAQALTSNQNFTNWNPPGTGRSYRHGPAGQFVDYGSPGYAFTYLGGRYRAFMSLYVQNGSGTAVASLRANDNLGTSNIIQQKPVPLLSGYGQVFEWHIREAIMPAGGLFFGRNDAGSLSYGGGWSELHVEYLGPPLVQA